MRRIALAAAAFVAVLCAAAVFWWKRERGEAPPGWDNHCEIEDFLASNPRALLTARLDGAGELAEMWERRGEKWTRLRDTQNHALAPGLERAGRNASRALEGWRRLTGEATARAAAERICPPGEPLRIVLFSLSPQGITDAGNAAPRAAALIALVRPQWKWRGEALTAAGPLLAALGARDGALHSRRIGGARYYSYTSKGNYADGKTLAANPPGVCWARRGPWLFARLDSSDPEPLRLFLEESREAGAKPAGRAPREKALVAESFSGAAIILHGILRLPEGALALEAIARRNNESKSWLPDPWNGVIQDRLSSYQALEFRIFADEEGGAATALIHWRRLFSPTLIATGDQGTLYETALEFLDNTISASRALEAYSFSAQGYSGDSSAPPPSIGRLVLRRNLVMESIQWVHSIAQISEALRSSGNADDDMPDTAESAIPAGDSREQDSAESAEQAARRKAEREARRAERRERKERQKALLAELAHPRTLPRLLPALEDWITLEIPAARLDEKGRWAPDWLLLAPARDPAALDAAVAEFLRGAERRDPAARFQEARIFNARTGKTLRLQTMEIPPGVLFFSTQEGRALTLALAPHGPEEPGERPPDAARTFLGALQSPPPPETLPGLPGGGAPDAPLAPGLLLEWFPARAAQSVETLAPGAPGGEISGSLAPWLRASGGAGAVRLLLFSADGDTLWLLNIQKE